MFIFGLYVDRYFDSRFIDDSDEREDEEQGRRARLFPYT